MGEYQGFVWGKYLAVGYVIPSRQEVIFPSGGDTPRRKH